MVPFSETRCSSTSSLEDDPSLEPEDADEAASPSGPSQQVAVQLHIVFSATFQVPALYFSTHYDSAYPLEHPRCPLG